LSAARRWISCWTRGFAVRALARRAQPERAGVTWVAGALDDPAALDDLVRGADVVLHIAGGGERA
jgi:uncharacterized protein YbjT (DUF2867 family)